MLADGLAWIAESHVVGCCYVKREVGWHVNVVGECNFVVDIHLINSRSLSVDDGFGIRLVVFSKDYVFDSFVSQ